MGFDRIINGDKLCLVAHLVGGPGDGMVINGDLAVGIGGEFRLSRAPKLVEYGVWDLSKPVPQPDFSYHVYIRVSEQRFEYKGIR